MSWSAIQVGKVFEFHGEMEIEWRIPEFLSLPEEVDQCRKSPTFHFSEASWSLIVYPKGESNNDTEGSIGVYLERGDSGPLVSLSYTFCIKTADGKKEGTVSTSDVFEKEGNAWGYGRFFSRSDLLERKSELMPSGVLTVICCLKHGSSKDDLSSRHGRQQFLIRKRGASFDQKKHDDAQ